MNKITKYIYPLIIIVLMVAVFNKPAPQVIYQTTDAQLIALREPIHLQPGDSVVVDCPSRLSTSNRTANNITLKCLVFTPTPSNATATHPPVSTATIAPADTETPLANVTNTPNPTNTPSGDAIQPFAGAPACASHDPNAWHGLWDYLQGCHYDHTHGDDPTLANSYFGEFGALWGGSTISYPFASSAVENTMKHNGYKISVRTPSYHPFPKCGTEDNTDITGDSSDNCVVAARVEYHLIGGLMDIIARYHSFYSEVYVCSGASNYTQCGIVRTGGLLDYGELKAPHYKGRIVRPGGTIDFGDGMVMTYPADGADLPANSGEPYVFSIPYSPEELQAYRNSSPRQPGKNNNYSFQATIDQWSTNDWDCEPKPAGDPCHNLHTHFLFQVGDAWNLVDAQNLNNVHWICKDEPGCEYDGSLIGMNEIAVRVLQEWQPNGGGFVTFNGYTDKWGNIKSGCTAITADCVPFVLERAPVGMAASRSDNGCECEVYEYDVYFNGKPSGWIKHPN